MRCWSYGPNEPVLNRYVEVPTEIGRVERLTFENATISDFAKNDKDSFERRKFFPQGVINLKSSRVLRKGFEFYIAITRYAFLRKSFMKQGAQIPMRMFRYRPIFTFDRFKSQHYLLDERRSTSVICEGNDGCGQMQNMLHSPGSMLFEADRPYQQIWSFNSDSSGRKFSLFPSRICRVSGTICRANIGEHRDEKDNEGYAINCREYCCQPYEILLKRFFSSVVPLLLAGTFIADLGCGLLCLSVWRRRGESVSGLAVLACCAGVVGGWFLICCSFSTGLWGCPWDWLYGDGACAPYAV